jgi:hypothetical protein
MKQYKLLKPEVFNLEPGEYLAKESELGYSMQVSEKHWLGFPKFVVEGNSLFEFAGEFKKKRPRIKGKKPLSG